MVSDQAQFEKIHEIWETLPNLQGIITFEPVAAVDNRVIWLKTLVGEDALNEEERREFETSISAARPTERSRSRGRLPEAPATIPWG